MKCLLIYPKLSLDLRTALKDTLPSAIEVIFADDVQDHLEANIKNAHYLLGSPPIQLMPLKLPQLQFWQLESAGFDQYKNIYTSAKVANMGDYFAQPCAETMLAGILAFYRRLPTLLHAQQSKNWINPTIRTQLDTVRSKQIVILGAGSIALALQKMLLAFGATVTLVAHTNPLARIHSFEELRPLLPSQNIVINTLPGTADHYVREAFFEAMAPGSLYASVGRGNTTDEHALIRHLKQGKLAGAVLDVTAQEPLPVSNPLWEMHNVILTQHTGGGQTEENEAKVQLFLANLQRHLQGSPLINVVDLKKGY